MNGPIKPYWYVYQIRQLGDVVYVGKGSRNRHRVSAKRCCGEPEIVRYFADEQKAFEYEKALIDELRPEFNRIPGGTGGRSAETVAFKKAAQAALNKRLESVFARKTYREARAGQWVALLCGLALARTRKEFAIFNELVGIAHKTRLPVLTRQIDRDRYGEHYAQMWKLFQEIQPVNS